MLYFAYGSNMDRARMDRRKTNYEYCNGATLMNYKLTFNKRAGYGSYSADDSLYPMIYSLQEDKHLWKSSDYTNLTGKISARGEFRDAGEGYANVVPSDGDYVEGVLYVVPDEGIVALDTCEGYPTHYNREVLPITLQSGAIVDAIVYVATQTYQEENLLPSDSYLAHLIAGKDYLSADYFKKLVEQPTIKKTTSSNYSNYNSGYSGSGYNRGYNDGYNYDDDYYSGGSRRSYSRGSTSNPPSKSFNDDRPVWNRDKNRYEYADGTPARDWYGV